MVWEQPQSFKSVCRWSTWVDMEKRRGRSALCTRSALHHAGEPSRFRPCGGATPSARWRVMPHPLSRNEMAWGTRPGRGRRPPGTPGPRWPRWRGRTCPSWRPLLAQPLQHHPHPGLTLHRQAPEHRPAHQPRNPIMPCTPHRAWLTRAAGAESAPGAQRASH
jgi:hypothetical protein